MDRRIKKKIYKIRHRVLGLFSTGGYTPRFVSIGKVWTQKNHLLLHLKQFSKYELKKLYKNCEIVVYSMEEIDIVDMTKLK
jgi:hypothetical protein